MSSIFWGIVRGEGLRWRGGGDVEDGLAVVVGVRIGSAVGMLEGGS